MPVKSKKQKKFFEAILHNPKFAKKVKVSKRVAREMLKKKRRSKK